MTRQPAKKTAPQPPDPAVLELARALARGLARQEFDRRQAALTQPHLQGPEIMAASQP